MGLTEKERSEFMTLSSGQISDAMEVLNLRRAVVVGMTLLGAPNTKFVGPASTIRQVPKAGDDSHELASTRHRELSRGKAAPGDVIVVDVGGRVDVASWGEYHGYHCKENGIVGVVIDGATRDAPEIREFGFPTFVRGFSPVKSRWDLKSADVNGPVSLGNITVNPGDIVFADETAIVIVASSLKEQVLAKAIEIRNDEERLKVKKVD